MKNNKSVHVVCILDKSGSMSRLTASVISNFNNFIDEQRKEEGKAFLTLILFDTTFKTIYNRVDINDVKHIDSKTYSAGGGTAMYDAVGSAIDTITDKNTLMLIQTDGQENSSRTYNKDKVMNMILEKEDIGWDFLFMGANIDTGKEGSKMGLRNKSVSFQANDMGIQDSFMGMGDKAKHYRYMKERDDNYKPPKDSELGSKGKSNKDKGPKLKWDKKSGQYKLA